MGRAGRRPLLNTLFKIRRLSWRRPRIERWRALAGALADSKPAIAPRVRKRIGEDNISESETSEADPADIDEIDGTNIPMRD